MGVRSNLFRRKEKIDRFMTRMPCTRRAFAIAANDQRRQAGIIVWRKGASSQYMSPTHLPATTVRPGWLLCLAGTIGPRRHSGARIVGSQGASSWTRPETVQSPLRASAKRNRHQLPDAGEFPEDSEQCSGARRWPKKDACRDTRPFPCRAPCRTSRPAHPSQRGRQ